jgi:hypothetical protein
MTRESERGVNRPIISLYSSISPNGENALRSEMYKDEVLQQKDAYLCGEVAN